MVRRKRHSNLSPRERLDIFLSCVDELNARPFVLDGLFEFRFHVHCDQESGYLTCEFEEDDQESFRSFLLTFRKFILNNEPANIDRVLKTCRRHVKSEEDELREVLDELKAVWRYQYGKGVIQMRTNGVNLTPEYVLDLWINGQYFHSDNPDKRKQLDDLLTHELPSVKIQLLWSLPILTQTIFAVGRVVAKALREDAFEFLEKASWR